MRTYKATITPTISGGNIEVKISANSVSQAEELIKTLPYFKNFVKMPVHENYNSNVRLKQLISLAYHGYKIV